MEDLIHFSDETEITTNQATREFRYKQIGFERRVNIPCIISSYKVTPPWTICLQNLLRNNGAGNVWFDWVEEKNEEEKMRRKPILMKAITDFVSKASNFSEPESRMQDKYLMRI